MRSNYNKRLFIPLKKGCKFYNGNGMYSFSVRNRLGKLHRVGAPAFMNFIKRKGCYYELVEEEWRNNGLCHRVGGPAITIKGMVQEWWYKGMRHRIDGPSIESLTPYAEYKNVWFIMGKEYASKQEWFEALTREDQVAYLFKLNK